MNKNPAVDKNVFVLAFTFSAKCQIEKPSIVFAKWDNIDDSDDSDDSEDSDD